METKTHDDGVAEAVRATLKSAGQSQKTLADHLGISQQAVSRRLAGEVEFSVSELISTALMLEIPLADLLPAEALAEAGAV